MGINERRHKEKEERIQRIQKAATELFSSRGYKETSMDDIAARAELGKGTVYYYFPNKEEIYWSVFKSITERFYKGIQSIINENQSLLSFIRDLFDYYVDWFRKHPEELHIMFPLGKNSPLGEVSPNDVRFAEHRVPLENHLKELAAKEDSPISGERLSRAIWNYLMGISLQLVRGISKKTIEKDINLFLDLLSTKITNE